MLKWASWGSLAGGLAGCAAGIVIAAPKIQAGMQEPGWIIVPMLILGAILGTILGITARAATTLWVRLRSGPTGTPPS